MFLIKQVSNYLVRKPATGSRVSISKSNFQMCTIFCGRRHPKLLLTLSQFSGSVTFPKQATTNRFFKTFHKFQSSQPYNYIYSTNIKRAAFKEFPYLSLILWTVGSNHCSINSHACSLCLSLNLGFSRCKIPKCSSRPIVSKFSNSSFVIFPKFFEIAN